MLRRILVPVLALLSLASTLTLFAAPPAAATVTRPDTSTHLRAYDDMWRYYLVIPGPDGVWWTSPMGNSCLLEIWADWVPNPAGGGFVNPYDSITFHRSFDGSPYSNEAADQIYGWFSMDEPSEYRDAWIRGYTGLRGTADGAVHYIDYFTSYTAHITDPDTGSVVNLAWSDPVARRHFAADLTPPVITVEGVPDRWVSAATVTVAATDPEAGIGYDEHENFYDFSWRAYPYGGSPGEWERREGEYPSHAIVLDQSAFPAGGPIVVECRAGNGVGLEATRKSLVNLNFGQPSRLMLNGSFLPDHAAHLHPAITVGETLWAATGTLDFGISPAPVAAALRYRLDGGAWRTTKTESFQLLLGPGVHEIGYEGIDGSSMPVEETQTLTFSVDGTPAALTVGGNLPGWHNIYALDLVWRDPETGIRAAEVQQVKVYKSGTVEPSQWQTWSGAAIDAAYLQGLGISPFEGKLNVLVRGVTNGVGLVSLKRAVELQMDMLAPRTSDSSGNAWHGSAWSLSLTPSDGGAGVQATRYRVDGGAWQSGTSVSLPEGIHSVDYFATDNAGNVEATKTCTARVDGTPPLTTQTGADDAWHQSPVTVSFTASDATSGVERTEYRLDAGSWTTGTQVTVLTDGDHTLRYRSQDRAGNLEEAKTCRVRIDRMPPVTTQTGADGRWHNLAVTVAFTASDRASGVASTSYSTDGGVTWETGTCIVEAPATHDNDGTHTILYRSADNSGLVEVPRSCTVRIDTRQPVTVAPSSTRVRRGYRATLRHRVDDQQPCAGKANVTIKVTTLGGRVVKVLKLGQRAVNRTLSCQFHCTLAKRTYKFRVYATDAAGNKQAVADWNRLIVR